MNDDDIWNGYRLGDGAKNATNINYMIAMQKKREERFDRIEYIIGCVLLIAAIAAFLVVPMIGPSLWHSALVVCNGPSCTTYTEWTVINENGKTGVLEVWAGGRLQRLSNGTWHYE